jgi:protein-L-isoaspartate(D-aspartate) O-methyltransferase
MSLVRVVGVLLALGCSSPRPQPGPQPEPAFAGEREKLVAETIEARDVKDPRVLAAMRKVPRHEFVPGELRGRAYEDNPLPIGEGQTISQPYIVALMTQLAEIAPNEKILEIGTGSGYQAAILGELAAEVYSIEIVEPLARRAEETLARLGYRNVHVRAGDGYRGWPDKAPFDAILLTAAPPEIPQPLLDQLAVGGRLVAPIDVPGTEGQDLVVVSRTASGYQRKSVLPVRFVPMTGEAQGK